MQGPHGCRLEKALKITENQNHKDAEAVMLEYLGNYQEAFDLLIKQLEKCLDLVKPLVHFIIIKMFTKLKVLRN